ncbi:MAG TPA: hypothetical protein VG711_04140, partial [Phycisphaerales bacterium]|nr:hypothetical protein [Phycisphaerales bacterium]
AARVSTSKTIGRKAGAVIGAAIRSENGLKLVGLCATGAHRLTKAITDRRASRHESLVEAHAEDDMQEMHLQAEWVAIPVLTRSTKREDAGGLRSRSQRRGGMMRGVMLAGALAGAGMLSQGAEATIFIRKADGTNVSPAYYTMTFDSHTANYTITLKTLYAPQQDTVYEIHGDGGENIDVVNIDVDGPAAGSPVIVRILSDGAQGVGSVYSVVQHGNAETLLNKVNIKGDLGEVSVQAIGDLTAGGDVTGPIVSTQADNSSRGINSVTAQGDILGDIWAHGGKISLVLAYGAIGDVGNPIEIQAKYGITQISALNGIHADVTTRFGGGTGKLWAMTTTAFDGTLDTEGLMSHPNNGSAGYLYYSQSFTGHVNIGKGFNGAGQYVLLPTGGLKGQITVNADNASGQTWTAPVKIGPNGDPNQVVISGPGYSQSRSSLGGGAVGLVPFGLYSTACTPANGATVDPSAGLKVKLTHYGPVTWQPGFPVSVEKRVKGSNGAWTVQPGVGFTYALDPNDANTLIVSGASGQPGFEGGYQYRIKATSLLKCSVNALPAVLWGADYLFTVNAAPATCAADITGDHLVNIDDLTQVILNWNTPFLPSTADVNHDNHVNIDDLTAVILSWGNCN